MSTTSRLLGLVLAVSCSVPMPLLGQDFYQEAPAAPEESERPFVQAPDLAGGLAPRRPARVQLFRMQPGYVSEPLGLEEDEAPIVEPDGTVIALGGEPAADDPVAVFMGRDNPHFDLRRRGDPGGLGYFRADTQCQLLDTGNTSCCLGFQTLMPAGNQWSGLEHGPTVISPALSWYHGEADGLAWQGFVGQRMHLNSRWRGNLGRAVQCGVAVQHPLPTLYSQQSDRMYFFVESLSKYRYGDSQAPVTVEVLPGIFWSLSETTNISGAVVVPNGLPHSQAGAWQITYSWKF